MRLLLNGILVIVAFFACYAEDFYLCVASPQAGEVASLTVRAQLAFEFDQEKALGNYRKIAFSKYVPLYDYVPDRSNEAKEMIEALSLIASTVQGMNSGGEEEVVAYLNSKFGLDLHRRAALKLLHDPNLKNILAGVMTIEESILLKKIVEDPEPLKGRKSIEVRYPEPTGIVAYSANEVITLEEARLALQERVHQLFWQLDEKVLEPLMQISFATLSPNLRYDQEENEKRIEKIIQQYPSKVIRYQPGDALVAFGEVLSHEDELLLASYRKHKKKAFDAKAPWLLIATLFMVGLYNLFLSKIVGTAWRKEPPHKLLLWLLIIHIIIFKACLLFTSFPIFALPFALLSFLTNLLHDERVAASSTVVMGAMLLSLFLGGTLEILLYFTFGGVVAVLVASNIRKRIHIVFPSLVVGIINVVILTAFSMDWGSVADLVWGWQRIDISVLSKVVDSRSMEDVGWAFVGGLLAGPAAMLFLPLLEFSLPAASNFKLSRYADLQHPLMKDLLTKAPATYQHTMTVAYLAQAVGEALGLNPLLLRIGAYYHDVGKMANPTFFAENQSGGKNPHDDLDPIESAKFIINHVRQGERLGRQMRLPQAIVDLISQHHGTQLVEFFYDKAIKSQNFAHPKKDFRYPGPKPQSIEAAILMIVDAVEAASRSMEEPTREKIERMIRLLVVKRVADGQFDECNLSTRGLAKIVNTLVESLEATLHSRVEYPWQKKRKGELRLAKTVGSRKASNA